MAVIRSSCVVVLALVSTLPTLLCQDDYKIPKLSFVALKPSGLVVSMPDDLHASLIVIKGDVNRQGEFVNRISISEPVKENSKDGFFTYRDNSKQMQVGDVICYTIVLFTLEKILQSKDINYTITELIDSNKWDEQSTAHRKSTAKSNGKCRPTSTLMLWPGFMKTICSGEIIFEDNFDTLRDDLWTVEEYIPSKPEHPFVSYQRLTVSVENGNLRIQPQLQENLPGFDSDAISYSTLDLTTGCTRPGSCVVGSDGGHILPPIASGRITSKSFSFKYGTVEVRARVPQGDWLYPDIRLESLFKKYGSDDYASGILTIAGVLGNIVLKKGQEEYGNKVLRGGPVMDFKCRSNLLAKKISRTDWGNDFHVYSLRWTQDTITLSVDGEEWGRIEAPINGLLSRLPRDTCGLLHRTFLKTPMAPFDDYFTIILGVSAGGVSEFPDDVVSLYTHPKPWKNTARRARLDFFTAKDSWLPTWPQPELLVDYIRVRAL